MKHVGHCVYCGKLGITTDEHALPKAIGGNLPAPNALRIRACSKCNNACGRFVDAPLARSFLILNDRANRTNYPSDEWPNAPNPIGYNCGETADGRQIDLWSYCGHWVIHFHDKYPRVDEAAENFGLPLPPTSVKPGHCFLYFAPTAGGQAFVDMCKDFFEGAALYCIQPFSTKNPFPPVPVEHQPDADRAQAMMEHREFEARLYFAMAGTDRFAAKISLALAANILGKDYLEHGCCKDVRDVLWDRTPDGRDHLRLKAHGVGTRLMQGGTGPGIYLALPTCHTFLISNVGGALAVFSFLYGHRELLAILCDCPDKTWPQIGKNGLVIVVSLTTKRVSEPVPLVEFIAWRGPHRQRSAKLDALGYTPPIDSDERGA